VYDDLDAGESRIDGAGLVERKDTMLEAQALGLAPYRIGIPAGQHGPEPSL